MNTRHVTSLVAAGAAIVMLLSGCGSTGTSNSSNASDSNIISVYGSEPAHPLFPGNTTEAGGGKVVDQLFAGLVTYDAKGGIHNEVADSITSSDNATHYVIKLKSGWKFTDGTPVTAHSFVNAWNYTANSANKQASASFFSTIEGYDDLQKPDVDPKATLSGLTVVDDNTIDVKLTPARLGIPGQGRQPRLHAVARIRVQGPEEVRSAPSEQRPIQVRVLAAQPQHRNGEEP